MPAQQASSGVDDARLTESETVALAYFQAAKLDGWSALVAMAADALADREALENRLRAKGRQISRGYVRDRLDG